MSHIDEIWPELPLNEWEPTYATLHMWFQIIGKVRLKLCPLVNHWWETALYVTPRGLTTSIMPHGPDSFEIKFDFIDHVLKIEKSDGQIRIMALQPKSVAAFYQEFMELMGSLDLQVEIDINPKEVPNPIPFNEDNTHYSYDRDYAERFWRILLQVEKVFEKFRSKFIGKVSPIHFFWGSFDFCVTRFSGRRSPPREGVDHITQEGYSHEVSSVGFWPGSGNINGPAFYAYAAPEPKGYEKSYIQPAAAFYNPPTKGFILMYDDVRKEENPETLILSFLESTYDAAANLGKWDRKNLERSTPKKTLIESPGALA